MANEKEKYIMLHIGKDQANEVLKDAIKQGCERGLVIRSEVGNILNSEFEKVKQRGYFPIGIIIDNSFNVEILFNRHPKQTKEMKMVEIIPINSTEL